MFKNLNISLKMSIGFLVIILISATIIIFNLISLKNVGGLASTMYNSPYAVTRHSLEICNELNKSSKDLRNALIEQDITKYSTKLDEYYNNIKENLTIIKSEFLGDATLVTNLETNLEKWKVLRDDVISLIKSNNYAEAREKIVSNLNGIFTDTYNNAASIYYSAVEQASDFNNTSNSTVTKAFSISLTLTVLALILAIIIIIITVKSIVNPINKLKLLTDKIADGQLDVDIKVTSNDEIGVLTNSFGKTVVRLKDYIKYIDEISSILNQIANGNLDFKLIHSYDGEFIKVKESLINISKSLNETLYKINITSEQVATGSKQVSDTAQSLAQGATDEASVVQQLVATVNEVSEKVDKNAENAQTADGISEDTNTAVISGREQMNQVVKAMENIQNNTNQIQTIIKSIEDISSQTNMLSLNAAIEAARAGEAGAGFAVVANEIGKLADESGKATKNTIELIEKCILATQNGSDKVTNASESLNQIVDSVKKTKEAINSIKIASQSQSESLNQIVLGIEQVSTIMQSNSAVSQESAATSEELSSQAEVLKNLVSKFTLKRD